MEGVLRTYFFRLCEKMLWVLVGAMVSGNTWHASLYKVKSRKGGLMISYFGSTARRDTILVMIVLDSLRKK